MAKKAKKKVAKKATTKKSTPKKESKPAVEAKPKEKKLRVSVKSISFGLFQAAYDKKKPLPPLDVVTEAIKQEFPNSAWLQNPSIHYSYYKAMWCKTLGLTARKFDEQTGVKTIKGKKATKADLDQKAAAKMSKAIDQKNKAAVSKKVDTLLKEPAKRVWPK